MKKISFSITILLLFSGLFCGPAQKKTPDVPYAATPYYIVEEMFKIVKVQKDDILYDLGCGDGRINIMAAKNFGAAGLGVDLDPELIKECRKNAAASRIDHLVSFREQDLFQTDLSEATVVTLYLYESVNFQLRPRLLSELKPGARIISHNFGMKEWQPDHISFHVNNNDQHLLYAWIVPANAGGIWTFEQIGTGEKLFKLQIDQTFQLIYGTLLGKKGKFKITAAGLTGDRISFALQQTESKNTYTWNMKGRISGHFMEGQSTPVNHPDAQKLSWKAWREPSSARPLDALKIEY